MPPQLITPRNAYLMPHTTFPEAIIGHIERVLTKFLGDPAYSKFYVGVTQNVEQRLDSHQRRKPEYKLMIPVYEEARMPHHDGFEEIEQAAIRHFAARGNRFTRPNAPAGRALAFDNARENAPPRTTLYLLVG